MTRDLHTEPARSRSRLAIELGLVFAASLVLTRGLSDLANVWGALGQHLFTLVALVFLALPYFVLTRRRASLEDHAMTWNGWARGVATALLLALITLIPFAIGHHIWRVEFLGGELRPALSNYLRAPVEIEGRPADLRARYGPEVLLWRENRDIYLQWTPPPGRQATRIELTAPGAELEMLSGREHLEPEFAHKGDRLDRLVLGSITARPSTRAAALRIHGSGDLEVRVVSNGKLSTTKLLKLGPARTPVGEFDGYDATRQRLSLGRSLGWLPLIILAQFLLVAFPEEFFYRGYIQTTLTKIWPKTWSVLWLHVGPAIVVTSALFALGHFGVDARAARLAVFFPSLLFGWLRDKTGTIVAPIVYHALCNLMVEAVAPHYF